MAERQEVFKGDTAPQVRAERGGYVLRMACPNDRDAVAHLCARAWPYRGDYVPAAWETWLADPHGGLLVVEKDGAVVAVAKLSFQSSHEAWLQGLRVDPEHRRRGLANWILANCLELARRQGARTARLATGSHNVAVLHTTANQGMECVAELLRYCAEPCPGLDCPPTLSPADARRVRHMLRESPSYQAAHGLYETYWCWQVLTARRLSEALRAGWVVGTVDADIDAQAVALVHPSEAGEEMIVGLLAGGAPGVTRLGRGLRALAAARGAASVEVKLPAVQSLRQAAVAAGFEPGEGLAIVFEKRWAEEAR